MRGGGGMIDDEERVGHAEIPTSFGPELRACLRCRLVKTYDQEPFSAGAAPLPSPLLTPRRLGLRFRFTSLPLKGGFEDWGFRFSWRGPFSAAAKAERLRELPVPGDGQMDREHDNVVNCTTPNFTRIISLMDPSRSWAARWLRIGRFIPGCYTLAVSEELPEEYQGICQDNNVQYVPPKRV